MQGIQIKLNILAATREITDDSELFRKRQIIGVYIRSVAYDIVQLEHLDNQIVVKVPSYLRLLFLLKLRYGT